MADVLKELTEQALRLPPAERVVLAESLLLTIDESQVPLVDEVTVAEFERRFCELRDGKVTGIPVEEALRQVRNRLKRQS